MIDVNRTGIWRKKAIKEVLVEKERKKHINEWLKMNRYTKKERKKEKKKERKIDLNSIGIWRKKVNKEVHVEKERKKERKKWMTKEEQVHKERKKEKRQCLTKSNCLTKKWWEKLI